MFVSTQIEQTKNSKVQHILCRTVYIIWVWEYPRSLKIDEVHTSDLDEVEGENLLKCWYVPILRAVHSIVRSADWD